MLFERFKWKKKEKKHLYLDHLYFFIILLAAIFINFMLYMIYAWSYGYNPFSLVEDRAPTSNSIQWVFQFAAVAVALFMPPIIEGITRLLNVGLSHTNIATRMILFASLVSSFLLPTQAAVLSLTYWAKSCVAYEQATGSVTASPLYLYWIVFPFVILTMPALSKLSNLMVLWGSKKYAKEEVAQEELDSLFVSPEFQPERVIYLTLIISAGCAFISGFSLYALLTGAIAIVLNKWAVIYNVRFQNSAPKDTQQYTLYWAAALMWIIFTLRVQFDRFDLGHTGHSYFRIQVGSLFGGIYSTQAFTNSGWPYLLGRGGSFICVFGIPESLFIIAVLSFRGFLSFMVTANGIVSKLQNQVGVKYKDIATTCEGFKLEELRNHTSQLGSQGKRTAGEDDEEEPCVFTRTGTRIDAPAFTRTGTRIDLGSSTLETPHKDPATPHKDQDSDAAQVEMAVLDVDGPLQLSDLEPPSPVRDGRSESQVPLVYEESPDLRSPTRAVELDSLDSVLDRLAADDGGQETGDTSDTKIEYSPGYEAPMEDSPRARSGSSVVVV